MSTTQLSLESGRQQQVVDAHVVLLTNFIPPYRAPLYRALAERVKRLTILISTPMESNRQWSPESEGLDVRVQRTLTVRRRWRHSAGFSDTLYVHLPWDTQSLLKQLQPDLVISGELGFRSLLSARYCRRHRIPLVLWATLSEHTEQGRGRLRWLLRRRLLNRAQRIIVNGASGRRYVQQFAVSGARISEVPYTSVPSGFEDVPLERTGDRAYHLLACGQLIERKGLMPLLTALNRWADRHPQRPVQLTLVGSGPLSETLDAAHRAPNVELKLLGERPYEQLPALYADAGIFVFPTLADEWGLVVNEAMAAGLPVLGSRYSQAVEQLCVEGEVGWQFRPDFPDETVAAIDRAMRTPVERLNQMRRTARQRAAHLTPGWAADRLAESLSQTLADGVR